jgi:hypothetical protein
VVVPAANVFDSLEILVDIKSGCCRGVDYVSCWYAELAFAVAPKDIEPVRHAELILLEVIEYGWDCEMLFLSFHYPYQPS